MLDISEQGSAQLKWAALADYVILDQSSKVSVLGMFERISVLNLPAIHPVMYVVSWWHGQPSGRFNLEQRIWAPTHQILVTGGSRSTQYSAAGRALAVQLFVGIQLPAAGNYTVEFLVDGRREGTVTFEVAQVQLQRA
jgi:hypothetical protein